MSLSVGSGFIVMELSCSVCEDCLRRVTSPFCDSVGCCNRVVLRKACWKDALRENSATIDISLVSDELTRQV
jgi:hypothetical protein